MVTVVVVLIVLYKKKVIRFVVLLPVHLMYHCPSHPPVCSNYGASMSDASTIRELCTPLSQVSRHDCRVS